MYAIRSYYVFSKPKAGISKNPAQRLPSTAPVVLCKTTRPTPCPVFDFPGSIIAMAAGRRAPERRVGKPIMQKTIRKDNNDRTGQRPPANSWAAWNRRNNFV